MRAALVSLLALVSLVLVLAGCSKPEPPLREASAARVNPPVTQTP